MLLSSDKLTNYGKKAEEYVSMWLTKNGFSVLARNYRHRSGEIDIIAKNCNVVSFIEVKYRTHLYFNVSEVIVPSKQRKIIHVAKIFISQHNFPANTIYRFDVALVTKKENSLTVDYYPNAFNESN